MCQLSEVLNALCSLWIHSHNQYQNVAKTTSYVQHIGQKSHQILWLDENTDLLYSDIVLNTFNQHLLATHCITLR